MTNEMRVSVTREIPASAEVIFSLITLPAGHVAMDGSGSLVCAPSNHRLTAVGDTFLMDMDREPIGDIPDMGKYQVENEVTGIETNRLLEWTVGMTGRPRVGHVYGIRLTPIDTSLTLVENYMDWSGVPEKWRDRVKWPVIPAGTMEASLARLEAAILSA
ncbi:unannotated protein [freshwater metagenome]|uniref:Unannotated protein n=1 Tax=freshwater metagenome TaxID=449393 RepID=A0A6J6ICQ8_9ZZZZ|nr:polyketide cyclase [Actinomycetota bacterium]MSY39283.1 polyketide cyclase [Actinomycetota bacterium]MSZ41478.1 polyketide cyclase [Actinomycetota bacterium]